MYICRKHKKLWVKMSYIGFLDCYKKYLVKDKVKNFVKKWFYFQLLSQKSLSFSEQKTSH